MELTRADGLRFDLAVRRTYLQLMTSILPGPGNLTNPEIRRVLIEVADYLESASQADLEIRGRHLLKLLDKMVEGFTKLAPPKVSLAEIAANYSVLCRDFKSTLHSTGVEYHWLVERMDCSKLRFPEDTPRHARIGVGHHAGRLSVEEEFLLRDAYYMLVAAEAAYEALERLGDELRSRRGTVSAAEAHERGEPLNQTVASYSRLCVVSFFAFVEAFVNSVGHSELLRHGTNLQPSDQEVLSGKRKGRYTSVEFKIERYCRIIRGDGSSPIVLSDAKQVVEPFKSFTVDLKSLRDSSVHFSPTKAAIWQRPEEWLLRAQHSAHVCMDVARQFWSACYPARPLPRYLGELDHNTHVERAKRRFQARYGDRADLLS